MSPAKWISEVVKSSMQQITSLRHFTSLSMREGTERQLLVIAFQAARSEQCRRVAPLYDALAERHATLAIFTKIDVGENPNLQDSMQVDEIPAFHVYRKGDLIAEFVGADVGPLERRLVEIGSQPSLSLVVALHPERQSAAPDEQPSATTPAEAEEEESDWAAPEISAASAAMPVVGPFVCGNCQGKQAMDAWVDHNIMVYDYRKNESIRISSCKACVDSALGDEDDFGDACPTVACGRALSCCVGSAVLVLSAPFVLFCQPFICLMHPLGVTRKCRVCTGTGWVCKRPGEEELTSAAAPTSDADGDKDPSVV